SRSCSRNLFQLGGSEQEGLHAPPVFLVCIDKKATELFPQCPLFVNHGNFSYAARDNVRSNRLCLTSVRRNCAPEKAGIFVRRALAIELLKSRTPGARRNEDGADASNPVEHASKIHRGRGTDNCRDVEGSREEGRAPECCLCLIRAFGRFRRALNEHKSLP